MLNAVSDDVLIAIIGGVALLLATTVTAVVALLNARISRQKQRTDSALSGQADRMRQYDVALQQSFEANQELREIVGGLNKRLDEQAKQLAQQAGQLQAQAEKIEGQAGQIGVMGEWIESVDGLLQGAGDGDTVASIRPKLPPKPKWRAAGNGHGNGHGNGNGTKKK